jgi:hypothetical protein
MSIGAAKQDSSVFADPDRVDITRSALGHLTFGHAGRYASARRWPGWSALSLRTEMLFGGLVELSARW